MDETLGKNIRKARQSLPKRSKLVGVSIPMELYNPMMDELGSQGIKKPQQFLLYLLMKYMKENDWVEEEVLEKFQ